MVEKNEVDIDEGGYIQYIFWSAKTDRPIIDSMSLGAMDHIKVVQSQRGGYILFFDKIDVVLRKVTFDHYIETKTRFDRSLEEHNNALFRKLKFRQRLRFKPR